MSLPSDTLGKKTYFGLDKRLPTIHIYQNQKNRFFETWWRIMKAFTFNFDIEMP
jgi:hypothetical protein